MRCFECPHRETKPISNQRLEEIGYERRTNLNPPPSNGMRDEEWRGVGVPLSVRDDGELCFWWNGGCTTIMSEEHLDQITSALHGPGKTTEVYVEDEDDRKTRLHYEIVEMEMEDEEWNARRTD